MYDYELLYYYRMNPFHCFQLIENEYRKLMFSAIHQVCYNFSSVCFSVDDAYQEGLITLVIAIDSYRHDKEASFSSYLYRCVTSSARLLVRKHRSLSFGLLDRCYSLQYPISSDDSLILMDVVAEEKVWYQPQPMANYQEIEKVTLEVISKLKPVEKQVFQLRNDGISYLEISQDTNLTPKKVDNILQKIRRLVKQELKGGF